MNIKTLSWTLVAVVCGGLVVGCTPSPEKVCTHVVEIMEKELGDKAKKKDDDGDKKKEFIADCVKKAEKEKADDPDGYKCSATCAMDAKSLDDFMGCDKKCPSKKKKGKGGDDDDKKKDDDGDKKDKKKKDKDD